MKSELESCKALCRILFYLLEEKGPSQHNHIKTRKALKDIPLVSEFNAILESCTLCDEDKEVLRLHYLKGKDFRYIGDVLGYSERTIKERHKKAIQKIAFVL